MALSLLLGSSEGGESSAHGRWTCVPELPTVLRESQVAAAGRMTLSAHGSHSQEQPEDLPQEDDAEVATLERIPLGWQLTRHSERFSIAVQRAFGGHEVQLPMPGSVALLCHGDVIWFSFRGSGGNTAAATLRVELPISSDRNDDSSGEESEELGDIDCAMRACGDAELTEAQLSAAADDGAWPAQRSTDTSARQVV